MEDCRGGSHRYLKQRRSGRRGEFDSARSDEQVWFPAGCLHPEEDCGRTGRLRETVIIPEHNKTRRLHFRLHVGLEIEVKMSTGVCLVNIWIR